MSDVNYEDVVRLADQLPDNQQTRLIAHLNAKRSARAESQDDRHDSGPTREELIAELASLRAEGAFENVESLYGRFANPNAAEMSAEDLHAQLRGISSEWEQELDEFDNNND